MLKASSSILFTFMLALILIYLILAAQFESFRDPLYHRYSSIGFS